MSPSPATNWRRVDVWPIRACGGGVAGRGGAPMRVRAGLRRKIACVTGTLPWNWGVPLPVPCSYSIRRLKLLSAAGRVLTRTADASNDCEF